MNIEKEIVELIRKHNLAAENLTEQQLAEVIRQAIACGDFVRYVQQNTNAQQVVYLPFAREAQLYDQLSETRQQLEKLLHEVVHKYPGETRYETALRYIIERERERIGGPGEEQSK